MGYNANYNLISLASAVFALGVVTGGTALAQAPKSAPGPSTLDIAAKRVTLQLENADIRSAVKLLFNTVGVSYTLESGVQGSVTVSLVDVPFRTALQSLLRSVSNAAPLAYRVDDGVYAITLRQAAPAQAGPAPAATATAAEKTRHTAKIALNYASARDLSTAFGGGMLTSATGRRGQGNGPTQGGAGGRSGQNGSAAGGFGGSLGFGASFTFGGSSGTGAGAVMGGNTGGATGSGRR